ncbi:hypothetical protein SAMN05216553_12316 [Lentzea fradiae]|uniref:Uncharacterized protein n=1 Tax=Lentzea fradiae TaxID=200378 RepID=A0A1G8CLG8_9PSEU|nr:hypothetical protein [Lentzea fradiae]SDH46387.1 hypothetical protein SAMN05216553_12316 [Lentzea fradiae]
MSTKRKLFAGIAGAVLAVTAIATSSSAAPAPQPTAAAPGIGIQAVAPGTATLRFDWGCTGSYSSTSITFNGNGTFTAGTLSGVWAQTGSILQFQFNGVKTTYASLVASNSGTGTQSTFTGTNGCHLLLGPGAAALAGTDSSRGVGTLGADGR